MSQAAFYALWAFVFVLPWDPLANLPILGSIPRIVGLVASAVGVLHILARRRVRPLSWFHIFTILFVLWAGVSSFWSIYPEATRMRFVTSLQLLVLVWLIWEIAWSPERQRGLMQAYVLGVCVAAAAIIRNYVSGASYLDYFALETARYVALNQDPNELGVILALGLPMAWYLGFPDPERRLPWVWRLYVPLGLTGILLTGSRGAFLTALVALATAGLTRLAPLSQWRLDVWPVGDYGVRQGYALAYGVRDLPSPKELLVEGDRFLPYRTVAAWYCWRAVEVLGKPGP